MNSLFGERATAELVGKLRLLTACELCKNPCDETFFAVECSHYTCRNCVRQAKNECAKCNVPGAILQAHYLDPISETLLKLKDILSADHSPKPTASKRKAGQDMLTPTSKLIKKNCSSERSAASPKSPSIDMIFARKSKPSGLETQEIKSSPSIAAGSAGDRSKATPSAVNPANDVTIGNISFSQSIRDSPVIRTNSNERQIPCSCGARGPTASPITIDSGVQVSNNVLTLDVSVHARPSMAEAQVQTDESMSGLMKPLLQSVGMQTERLHVPVKRYFEAAIQTDDELTDKLCPELCSEAKSLTSTQAVNGNQTVHAQPISLDMSPIKRFDRPETDAQTKTITKPEKDNAEDTMDFSGDDLNQDVTSHTNGDITSCSKETSQRDTLDSLDYRTMELKKAGNRKDENRIVERKQRSPEPDSLDSLPSEIFKDLEKAQEQVPAKETRSQKDTLESFFRSSEETSVPETEPNLKFGSPTKVIKSKRAVIVSEADSPIKLIEKKKKTIILSDEDEASCKAPSEEPRGRPSRPKLSSKVKENKMQKKSQSRIAKALPTFSSDEDDVDPLPMDTEDLRNLEKEIENLDREMEDSKTCGKSRF
ncbi:muscle M-line assembly protein unc-89 [Galendromus occidentalis]|uniref:Muscle M-line assembly protein unc-89 n=1 Tax=Galendromus occidentalis TaxID=34638 RepID=A0AAJ6QR69_9ACAR|nr:muscle M-line assembly protein unc-89 [Galendromus occidentalis]